MPQVTKTRSNKPDSPAPPASLSEAEKQALIAVNPQAWLMSMSALNNKGRPMEWEDRLWMHQILVDPSSEIVVRKGAQIGMSTCEIFKILHRCTHDNITAIYILPTYDNVRQFVSSKVDPIMEFNHIPASQKNSIEQKVIGRGANRSFLFFKGSWTEREAIMLDADALVFDEFDSCDQDVLTTYESRVQASLLAWMHRFSTPTVPNQRIDAHFNRSDAKYWFVRCPRGHEQFLDWPKNVCFERCEYVCEVCGEVLTKQNRRLGRWVKKWRDRDASGYWVSQLMAPWITCDSLIEVEKRMGKQYFFNFCLGKPYSGSDITVTEGLITSSLKAGPLPKQGDTCMGVDVGGKEHHYVIGNEAGIGEIGVIGFKGDDPDAGYNVLEGKIREHNVRTCVIDGNPHTNESRALAEVFSFKVYLNFFRPLDIATSPYLFDDEKFNVNSDRQRILSEMITDFHKGKISLYLDPTMPEFAIYRKHFGSLFLRTETDKNGVERQVWANGDNPDHFALATGYWRVALSRYKFAKEVFEPETLPDATDEKLESAGLIMAVEPDEYDWYNG